MFLIRQLRDIQLFEGQMPRLARNCPTSLRVPLLRCCHMQKQILEHIDTCMADGMCQCWELPRAHGGGYRQGKGGSKWVTECQACMLCWLACQGIVSPVHIRVQATIHHESTFRASDLDNGVSPQMIEYFGHVWHIHRPACSRQHA